MVASPFYSLRFQILTAAFAVITLVFPTKAASNDTSLRIGPVVWPSDPLRDPYHVHSGHVIRRAGSKSYDELDLLSFLSPSMHNSVSIILSHGWCKANKSVIGHTFKWHLIPYNCRGSEACSQPFITHHTHEL